MREAIGGTWLFGIMMGFIVFFSSYLAISLNYTKAFNVKNQMITIIEENEGFTVSRGTVKALNEYYVNMEKSKANRGDYTPPSSILNEDGNGISLSRLQTSSYTEDKIYLYLLNTGYATTKIESKHCKNRGTLYKGGYCVQKKCSRQGAYYRVTSFVKIELPFIWDSITIPISGETKVLYYTNDDIGCS